MFALERRDIERELRNAKPKVHQHTEIPTQKSIRNIFTKSAIPPEILNTAPVSAPNVEIRKGARKGEINWSELSETGVGKGPKRGTTKTGYKPPSYNNYSDYGL